jgi:aspartyl-tRNA(Asn)/glutamyl-tRNA(Gln) amidotransferase subunit B
MAGSLGPIPGKAYIEGSQMTDTSAVDAAIEAVIAANPDKVEELKAKPKLAVWFIGQVMKQTDGEANPVSVYTALKQRLKLPHIG